mmetsp:Transcript_73351/g.138477  ORF Transcript_73351/g.138477 Transcript_73351/m.138477 type:complete len:528 (+) Transcript_73351:70-1653(+)
MAVASRNSKPNAPAATPMFGKKQQSSAASASDEISTVGSFSPVSRFASAEVRWHAMMAESQAKDAEWDQAKPTEVAPPQKAVIASPHRAAAFRKPGAAASSDPLTVRLQPSGPRGPGPPPGAPLRATAEVPGARTLARGGRSRLVNSKSEAKPVAGQQTPGLVAQREGSVRPPPMHPAMMMRKKNGALPQQRPAPPRNKRPQGQPPRPAGMPPRPPPEVLARLRAQGPPQNSPLLSINGGSNAHTGVGASSKKLAERTGSSSALASDRSIEAGSVGGDNDTAKSSDESLSSRGSGRLAKMGKNIVSSPFDATGTSEQTAAEHEEEVDAATRAMALMEESNPSNHTALNGDTLLSAEGGGGDQQELLYSGGSEWIRMWDAEMASNYYYNQTTGEASWIPPEDFQEPPDSDLCGDGAGGGGGGGGDDGGAWAGSEGVWERYWDSEAHAYYAHNPTTGETRWVSEGDARFSIHNANGGGCNEKEAPIQVPLGTNVTGGAMVSSASAMSSGIMATAEPKISASGKYMVGDW